EVALAADAGEIRVVQCDLVRAGSETGDAVRVRGRRRIAEHEAIQPRAADQGVVSGTPVQRVVAAASVEIVRRAAARNDVVEIAGDEALDTDDGHEAQPTGLSASDLAGFE